MCHTKNVPSNPQDLLHWDAVYRHGEVLHRVNRIVRVLATLLIASAVALQACVPADSPSLQQGDPAPEFSAESMGTGELVPLSDYKGRTVLINLWATWCIPCRTEVPYLQRLHEEYRDQGFEVVGVSVDSPGSEEQIRAFLEEMGATYDILLDPYGRSEATFLARGLPNSILIDAEGVVAFSWLGPIAEDDPTFLRGLETALEDRASQSP